jgi:hypothetical protein
MNPKHVVVPVALAAALLAACGGSSSGQGGPPLKSGDLYPLGTGARWTYRITDPLLGVFQKDVWVDSQGTVPAGGPEAGAPAAILRNVEPTLDETTWALHDSGLVFRAREEDRQGGVLVKTTTWAPAEVKMVAMVPAAGWVQDATVHQTVVHADGTVKEKDERFVWTVAATGEHVTVPAGTFECIRVVRTNPAKTGSERTYWLAPGVGKVKETGERTEELVSYVAPPAG